MEVVEEGQEARVKVIWSTRTEDYEVYIEPLLIEVPVDVEDGPMSIWKVLYCAEKLIRSLKEEGNEGKKLHVLITMNVH